MARAPRGHIPCGCTVIGVSRGAIKPIHGTCVSVFEDVEVPARVRTRLRGAEGAGVRLEVAVAVARITEKKEASPAVRRDGDGVGSQVGQVGHVYGLS